MADPRERRGYNGTRKMLQFRILHGTRIGFRESTRERRNCKCAACAHLYFIKPGFAKAACAIVKSCMCVHGACTETRHISHAGCMDCARGGCMFISMATEHHYGYGASLLPRSTIGKRGARKTSLHGVAREMPHRGHQRTLLVGTML
jgi:hypothetical protein